MRRDTQQPAKGGNVEDREYVFWRGYIRGIADQLDLRDWDIRLSRESCDDDAGATVQVWYGQKRATLRLNLDLYRQSHPEAIEDQRRQIVHELLHCHSEYLEENRRVAAEMADRTEREKLQDAFDKRAIEVLIDGLATPIARFFSLPYWGAGDE